MSTEKIFEVSAGEISSIRIKCTICRIHLRKAPGENIRLSYSDTGCRTLKIKQTGDALNVSDKAAFTLYELFNLIELNKDKDLIVEVPSSYAGEIVASATTEPVAMEDLDLAGRITVHTQVSEIRGQQVRAREIRLSSNNGRMTLSGMEPEELLTMEANIGGIQCTLKGHPSDYSVSAQSQHGNCQAPPANPSGRVRVHASAVTGGVMIDIV